MEDRTAFAGPLAPPEAVIAGTLCLMSCFVQHPAAIYAERIAGNLAQMAGLPALSPEMRALCRRLAERWDGILNAAQQRADAGANAASPAADQPRDGFVPLASLKR